MSRPKQQRDFWVIWLTGLFVLVSFAVFMFAILRNRRNSDEVQPGSVSSPDHQVSATTAGEFKVVRVADGDSLTVVGADGIDLAVRLRGIDAPELGQPYGLEAKQALQAMLGSHSVMLDDPVKGKYGRYVANVYVGETWINQAMVASGHAWCDQVNSYSRAIYAAEQQAKTSRLGLWAFSTPIPPWIWRAERK